MIILLEGPDKCGKSTLAKNLSKLLDLPIKKHSETSSAQEAAGSAIEVLSDYSGGDEIWDRFYYPSDLIYSNIAGDYYIPEALKKWYKWDVSEQLLAYDVILVYCYAPIEDILHRLEEEPDHYVNKDQLTEVVKEYRNIVFNELQDFPRIVLNSGYLDEEGMVIEFYNQLLKIKGVLE